LKANDTHPGHVGAVANGKLIKNDIQQMLKKPIEKQMIKWIPLLSQGKTGATS